ncbi:MAG TPA: ribosome silencing factor [Ramlibacter sp.]|nr:ribosome silencing factor [Ramlibacter sp.]
MTQEAAAKKDTQRLQRAIVDGLEDVKAQDITVFNTEHLSPLFERVIVASGTSNRQTKALASSVRDAVREAGFPKPRIEGEENGEWIIVDCGAAVAHIMQPAIRQYYHLEEIWGDKPVRLKFGSPKPVIAQAEEPAARKSPARKATGKTAGKTAGKTGAKTAVKTTTQAPAARGKSVPAGAAAKAAPRAKPAVAKAPAKVIVKAPAKTPARKAPAKKASPARKPAAKKSPAR